jgi:hypothetical protein
MNYEFVRKQSYRELQKELKYLIKNYKFKVIKCKVMKEKTNTLNQGYNYILYIELYNKGNDMEYVSETLLYNENTAILGIRFKEYRKSILENIEYINFFPNIEKFYNELKRLKGVG